MMLIPIRTFSVLAASHGISVMPWNHSPRAITGICRGKSVIIPNGNFSSERSEASGTMIRSSVQTESKSSSSASAVRSSSSLTVTLSRKLGRYRASFIAGASSGRSDGASMSRQWQRQYPLRRVLDYGSSPRRRASDTAWNRLPVPSFALADFR